MYRCTRAFTILVCAALLASLFVRGSAPSIAFVILSQHSDYDTSLAYNLRDSLTTQANDTNIRIGVFVSHVDLSDVNGAWAVVPLFKRLRSRLQNSTVDWLFLCEHSTVVNLTALIDFLGGYNPAELHYIGRALVDESPTIIHHFFGYDRPPESRFLYADFAGGVAMSWALVDHIDHLSAEKPTDFAIDPKHELSRMLLDWAGISLVDAPKFCLLRNESECITRFIQPNYESCDGRVSNEDVFFAVKTFSGYHKTRVVVVKRTWAKTVKYIEYFSDTADHYVPTIDLGINNTQRGHCSKTLAILKHFLHHDEVPHSRWLVVVDDDTLLSAPRLYRLLSCYSPQGKLIIGERYGYGFSADGHSGYDYPTGGAGMIFSRPAVRLLVSSCRCPHIDSPDDMIIGMCAKQQSIPILHSGSFHQARPVDYPSLYLQRLLPISFHKFDEIDPYEVYMQRLHDADAIPASRPLHFEL
uniref:Beta-1,3-glucosyltransferase n=1 Tax=Parascaris univalens TaxID=6257 RepID=A0A915CJS3_PARUN